MPDQSFQPVTIETVRAELEKLSRTATTWDFATCSETYFWNPEIRSRSRGGSPSDGSAP